MIYITDSVSKDDTLHLFNKNLMSNKVALLSEKNISELILSPKKYVAKKEDMFKLCKAGPDIGTFYGCRISQDVAKLSAIEYASMLQQSYAKNNLL